MKATESIKRFIEKSKQMNENGEDFHQQAFVNYIEEKLGLKVVEVENLGSEHSYKDEYELTALSEKLNAKYDFRGEYYDFNEFNPKENLLTLKKIYGEEGEYVLSQKFYMSGDNKRGEEIISTPLKELIEGVGCDKELDYTLGLLKQALETKEGYKYHEREENDPSTFRIELGDESNSNKVLIAQGFSNTFQIEFSGVSLSSTQLVFRDIDKDELANNVSELSDFIDGHLKGEIVLDGKHNVSQLYEALKDDVGQLNANPLIKGSKSLIKRNLDNNNYWAIILDKFQLGDWDTYEQIEIYVGYDFKSKKFGIEANYLFKKAQITCNNVEEVIKSVEELKALVNNKKG